MNKESLFAFLRSEAERFNQLDFVEKDPISIPHQFSDEKDIEVSGLLTALISWGRRDLILRSAKDLMERMDSSPFEFVIKASSRELEQVNGFVYRTFQSSDPLDAITCLRGVYMEHDSLEEVFMPKNEEINTIRGIGRFRESMLSFPHHPRFTKHLANPEKGSAAKRIHMYLRWMVRRDENGVDLGIWKRIPKKKLMIPLDVHSGNIARELGLIDRKPNDIAAVIQLTEIANEVFPEDPCLLDYALFGLGVSRE